MVSLLEQRSQLYKQYNERRDALLSELEALDTTLKQQLLDLEATCERIQGHEDDGGPFYPECKHCGYTESF